MNTAKFLAVCVCFSALAPMTIAQNTAQPTSTASATCEEWFFHFPQVDQLGTLLGINREGLRNPRNLKADKQNWLEFIEVPAFKQNFYGQKVAGLTLYYDPCRQAATFRRYETFEQLAASEAISSPAPLQSTLGQVPQPILEAASGSRTNCDADVSWQTIYRGKSGKEAPFTRLVRERKLTSEEAKGIAGSEDFLNLQEAFGGEYSIRKNTCTSTIRLIPTLVTQKVVSDAGQGAGGERKGSSKIRTFATLGGTGLSTYFMIAGNYGLASATGGASLFVVPILERIFHRKPKTPKQEPDDTEVTSKVTYQAAADQQPVTRPIQTRPTRKYSDPCKVRVGDGVWHKFGDCPSRNSNATTTFRMNGKWWERY